MRIAVIGWGPLIWCPGCLRIKSRWHCDGPALPIEFARISSDGRLTLVIHPGPHEQRTPEQRTYWALSEFDDLKAARKNLQDREDAKSLDDIPSLTSDGQEQGKIDREIAAQIRAWLSGRQNVQASVWTGLRSNWPQKSSGKQFMSQDAFAYLRELETEKGQTTANRAREYIRNAPPQIQTPLRRMMQVEKGWEDAILPTILFEHAKGNA